MIGVTALDAICAQQMTSRTAGARSEARPRRLVRVERVTTVSRPIEEVYQFWKNFENFPRFMRHIDSVEVTGENRSRWRDCRARPAPSRREQEQRQGRRGSEIAEAASPASC